MSPNSDLIPSVPRPQKVMVTSLHFIHHAQKKILINTIDASTPA
jgi:hypothetical protein